MNTIMRGGCLLHIYVTSDHWRQPVFSCVINKNNSCSSVRAIAALYRLQVPGYTAGLRLVGARKCGMRAAIVTTPPPGLWLLQWTACELAASRV